MTQAKTAARELAEDFWEKWRNGRLPEGNHIVVNLEAMILAQRAAVWREADEIVRFVTTMTYSGGSMREHIRRALAAKAKEESNG